MDYLPTTRRSHSHPLERPDRMAKPVAGQSIKTLSNILAGDAQMATWHERMRRESRLTAAVRRGIPRALADRVRVVQAEPPLLVLGVPSGAVAAAIRQRSPEILAGLRREGNHFTELRVQVQLGGMAAIPPKVAPGQRVRINAAPLRALAAGLPEGPLRSAIERLARRCG